MFGFVKMLWIEGIHRVSVVKANALTSTAPLFTLFFAWLILHNTPTIWQLSSFIPMFIGILLLGINKQPTKQEKSSS
jgi:drug/metabolite transporter (DMT)-like permease